jgi:hypothetical protein
MKQSTSEVGPAWNFKINIGQHTFVCSYAQQMATLTETILVQIIGAASV